MDEVLSVWLVKAYTIIIFILLIIATVSIFLGGLWYATVNSALFPV